MLRTQVLNQILILLLLTHIPADTFAGDVVSRISPDYENSESYWKKTNHILSAQIKIPFFFNVPYTAFSPLPENITNQYSSKNPNAPVLFDYRESPQFAHNKDPKNDLGLRLIVVRGADRKATSSALADSGLFQTGDIVLSFRPEWFGTLRYSHIQLGISHSGLLYFQKANDGKTYLKNLDMPLDEKHVGPGFLNSEHYIGAPYLHVVRARNLSELQKSNLAKWLELMAAVGPKAYENHKIRFNQNYADPKFREGQELKFVADLGRIALGVKNSQQLTNYCSEFVWSMLSLRNCDPASQAIQKEFASQTAPSCIQEIFPPMPVIGTVTSAIDLADTSLTVGLADGVPLLVKNQYSYMKNSENRLQNQYAIIDASVLESASGKGENISSGHRAVEEMLEKLNSDFFYHLTAYFKFVISPYADESPDVQNLRILFNKSQLPNYSPTSFMVHSILPPETSIKAIDYVGTIHFGGKTNTGGKSVDTYELLRSLDVTK